MIGKIKAISISNKKGIIKTNTERVELVENWGIVGDAHAGNWNRQISLLAIESINKINDLIKLNNRENSENLLKINPGMFAENITTENIDLLNLNIGDKLKLGNSIIEITQIGKECHKRCVIYDSVGDCVMPREGIFAKVIQGGIISINDSIEILDK